MLITKYEFINKLDRKLDIYFPRAIYIPTIINIQQSNLITNTKKYDRTMVEYLWDGCKRPLEGCQHIQGDVFGIGPETHVDGAVR